MDQTLVNKLFEQFVSYIATEIKGQLVEALKTGLSQNRPVEDILDAEFGTLVKNMPKKESHVPAAVPSSSSSTGSVTTAPKAPSSTKDLKPLLINGEAAQCEGTVQKTGERCTHKAKLTIEGKHYCGIHGKSAAGKQADPNKKPGNGNKGKTVQKNSSSFHSMVNTTGSSSNSFGFGVKGIGATLDDDEEDENTE